MRLYPPWDPSTDGPRLRRLWDRGATRETLCAAFAPRPWSAILYRARQLRLAQVPAGWCSISVAARRAGYDVREFVRLLATWRVRTRPHPRPSHLHGEGVSRRWRLVSWARVARRLREHLEGEELETVTHAAARLELPRASLYQWARRDGVWPSRLVGQVVRLPSSVWDAVAARHRRHETAVEAARRLHVHPTTLRGWMRASNERHAGPRRVERHPPDVWDRLATTRRRRDGTIARRARAA